MKQSLLNRLALLFLPLCVALGCGTENPDQAALAEPAPETAALPAVSEPEAVLLMDLTLTDSVVLEGEILPDEPGEE